MKIVILSDIHANYAALSALPEENYDQIWCLGDLVDYGPQPREVIEWMRKHANKVIRGNHDHAVGFNVDPKCSLPFQRLASETRRYTQDLCTAKEIAYLRNLPIRWEGTFAGSSFYLVHAVPTDPLFGYCKPESERWITEVKWTDADFLLVGHTHLPFVRKIGKTTIVNPGSLGQPKTGRPLACYAVWEDGEILLKEYDYPLAETEKEIDEMPLAPEDRKALVTVLETGHLPQSKEAQPAAEKG